MKPHLLIKALVARAGGALPTAAAMKVKTFQGTLWKICEGKVTSPSRSSAERIAKHFGIPVDAIYDEKIAEGVWRERFGRESEDAPALMAPTTARAPGPPPQNAWPFRRMSAEQWDALDAYDRVLVEAAAVSKLRELLAEREALPATTASNVQKLVSNVDTGRQRRGVLTQEQMDRRTREDAVEIERRHFDRRSTGGKS